MAGRALDGGAAGAQEGDGPRSAQRVDAFSSIVAALRQGRIIFDNIRKLVVYLLSGNGGEILSVVSLGSDGWLLIAGASLAPLLVGQVYLGWTAGRRHM